MELIDIVDEQNNVCGTSNVADAHEKKLRHRVVGVFVFDSDNQLYLQKDGKYGKRDLSVGGHVHLGESYADAAVRETEEELGLSIPLSHVTTFLPENARMNHFWSIYTATAPDAWVFQPTEEVSALERMSIPDIKKMIELDSGSFTYGFLNTLNELVHIRKL